MALRLVPCKQDEEKWVKHYMAQAMKQVKPKEMTKPIKEVKLQPKYVLPTAQLVAQAESEMKQQKKEMPVFTPIKATPEFASEHTSVVTVKQSGSKKRKAATTSSAKSRKKTQQQQQQQAYKKRKLDTDSTGDGDDDIFV